MSSKFSGRLRQPTIFYGNFLSLFDYLMITQSKSRIRSVVNVQYIYFTVPEAELV